MTRTVDRACAAQKMGLPVTRRIILRTPAEKADLDSCWSRPDVEFFASGACHVLAAAFLIEYPEAGFQPWRIIPGAGHRGGHMVVMCDDLVFDWAGYERCAIFLVDYFAGMRSIFPDWHARFESVDSDPIGWEFCHRHHHRHPSQFRGDALARARVFARKLPPHLVSPPVKDSDR
jgi:hypothetical protein